MIVKTSLKLGKVVNSLVANWNVWQCGKLRMCARHASQHWELRLSVPQCDVYYPVVTIMPASFRQPAGSLLITLKSFRLVEIEL